MKFRIAGAQDGAIILESMPGRLVTGSFGFTRDGSPVESVAVSDDGRQFALVHQNGLAQLFLLDDPPKIDRSGFLPHGSIGLSYPPWPRKTLRFTLGNRGLMLYSGGGRYIQSHVRGGGTLGRSFEPSEDTSWVALSPDGLLGVVGQADGIAKLWKLPGPKMPIAARLTAARKLLRDHLDKEEFEQLEKVYSESLADKKYISDGEAELQIFYENLSWKMRFDPSDPEGETLLEKLRKWAAARPDSPAPCAWQSPTH